MRRLRFFIGALIAALWVAPLHAQEPTGMIRGRVTDDATRQPLAGVSVSFAGRTALTQADGTYFLTVPARSDTARARMLGYASERRITTVAAGQSATVDFSLVPQAIGLSEIVVTGYGEQRAGDITGAVSTVSSDEFNTGRIVSAAQLISAKAPGVQVVDNNEPGGGLAIRIRGTTSANASSDPLYIVDGMPLGGTSAGTGLSAGRDGLNFLNPNDIENVTVLRDASASAIYGANAANGVVIITTRGRSSMSGRSGLRFEYTGSLSSSSVDRLPSMLNAEQFRAHVDTFANSRLSQLGTANTDWFGAVTQTAMGQDHNFSVTSSAENNFFRLSIGYLNQDGIMQGTNVERVTLGVNYQQMLFNNRVDLRVNLKGSRADDQFTPGGVIPNAAAMGPTQPILDDTTVTGFYNWPGGLSSADNPAEIVSLASDHGRTYRGVGNAQLSWRLPWVQGLKANLNLGFDVANVNRASFTPSTLHREVVSPPAGNDYRREPSEQNQVLETYLNYAAPLGPGSIDATAGYSYTGAQGQYPSYSGDGLSNNFLQGNGQTPAQFTTNLMDVQESKLISFFGRANYNIRDRYLVAFSIRHDGSSRFGSDNAWGNFPSISLGWRLSEEGFLRGRFNLSDLKLRGGWATTGNQAFANYQQFSTYGYSNDQARVLMNGTWVALIRPSAVDPNIKWEETEAKNIGFDFGFWNQRMTGSLEWYTKDTRDMIFTIPAAAGTNFSNYFTTNVGSMRNNGIELTLNARLMDGNDRRVGWNIAFNASHNTNELTTINPNATSAVSTQINVGDISGAVGNRIQVLRPGLPVNSFLVYEHIMDNGRPIYRDENGDNTINEQDLYVDQNGDGTINADDLRPYKDPAPKWILGFSNYLTYGRLSLDFTLRAWLGNYVYNNVASDRGHYQNLNQGSPFNMETSVLETRFATPQYFSDYYVEDASFLRLDNITLAYRFNYRNQPIRVFGTVQNAFTITGYSGVDPTAGLNGIDRSLYPRSRTYSAGLTLQF